jgi:RNA polymerase sigma factor (sigma-70 family)
MLVGVFFGALQPSHPAAHPETMPLPEDFRWFNSEVRPLEPALRAYLNDRFPVLADHDDLMQEAFCRVYHAHRRGHITHVKTFLFAVTRNLAIDMFRKLRSVADHQPLTDYGKIFPLEEPMDARVSLEREQRHLLVINAIAQLPERCRKVMTLRYRKGLHIREIAKRLRIAPNTVKVHLAKGVRDCAAYFRKHGLLDAEASAALDRKSA